MLSYLFRKRSKPPSSLSPLESSSAFLQLPDARPEILQVHQSYYYIGIGGIVHVQYLYIYPKHLNFLTAEAAFEPILVCSRH